MRYCSYVGPPAHTSASSALAALPGDGFPIGVGNDRGGRVWMGDE